MKKLSTLLTLILVCVTMFACVKDSGGPIKPPDDGGNLDPDVDSWLQIDPDDVDVEIDWYIDSSSYYISPTMTDKIYKATGVKINWIKPATDDGTKLGTYLASNSLPDVVTINDYAIRSQLAEEGYCWALNTLATKYAPSLTKRIDRSIYDYYKASDNNLYCLPANGYTEASIEEFSDMGNSLISNGALIVRKDYLEAYLAYKKSVDANFNQDEEVTTKAGFIEMCKWVANEYDYTLRTNPTVALSPFLNTGSVSITQLAEYFCVAPEDSDGNLTYQPAQAEYKEGLLFLNELYREGLITEGNLSASASAVGGYIQNGLVFAFLGSPQQFGTQIRVANINKNIEYVPIVITNDAGEAPLLTNLAGYGNRFTMISKNCDRVDRVIKMVDWLMSEEGHVSLYYGEEGVTFNYVIRPGETKTITVNGVEKQHTYTYGQVEFTENAWSYIQNGNQTALGLRATSLLWNPMYVRLTSVRGDELDTYQYYLQYNTKAALTPYTYSKRALKYAMDPTAKKYDEMVDIDTDLTDLWAKRIPQIILASSAAKAEEEYDKALNTAKVYGYEDLLKFQNECFQKHKKDYGVKFAWPKNNADYVAPAIRLLGDTSYTKEIPSNITKR